MSVLNEITEKVRSRVEQKKKTRPVLENSGHNKKRSLKRAILNFPEASVIGELKKSSPSVGKIRSDFHVRELAKSLDGGGARAISVLTEPEYFDGSLEYLSNVRTSVDIPILRKDFIIDEYQLRRSAEVGADAVLLIVEILGKELERYVEIAHRLGLEVLVEASDKEQALHAESAGADLIGINNRNLKTMEVSLERTKDIVGCTSADSVVVSESGIEDRNDIERVIGWGADAVLVGTALMKSGDVEMKMRELVYGEVDGKD